MSGHMGLGLALLSVINDLDPPEGRQGLRTRRRRGPPYGSNGCLEGHVSQVLGGPSPGWPGVKE